MTQADRTGHGSVGVRGDAVYPVLIIDDHELFSTSLRMALRGHGVDAHQVAPRGRDGILGSAAELTPGLVVLDLELGRGDDGSLLHGSELVAELKGAGWQVLIVSGSLDRAGTAAGIVPGAAADAPAGDQLISLKDVNAHQVVVPFSEADGAKITRDRSVEVSFEQLPGVVSPARVAAIEPPVPGRSAGYLVTVVLNRPDERLTDGLAARVAVATDKIDNAMVVPASAVRINGRTGTVTQLAPDGAERETSVELGMIGDRTIQILSGLNTNDHVRAVHDG